jgi:hypothetical protein
MSCGGTQTADSRLEMPIVESGSHEYPEDVVTITFGKRLFYSWARQSREYLFDADVTKELFADLKDKGVDLFTFVQRSYLQSEKMYSFPREDESIALLKIESFDDWWRFQVRTEERNRVRKAEKKGIEIKSVKVDEHFIRNSHKIYNETPVRQGRRYTGYGLSLEAVRQKFSNLKNSEILGAYYNGEVVGLLWMIYGDQVARIASFVSLVKHRDKAPNNALFAGGVKRLLEKGFHFIVYERFGYLPNLDSFKRHNGFRECIIPRYYVPLSNKGMLAIRLRAHREVEHFLSPRISRVLLPIYSLASRAIPSTIWQRVSE